MILPSALYLSLSTHKHTPVWFPNLNQRGGYTKSEHLANVSPACSTPPLTPRFALADNWISLSMVTPYGTVLYSFGDRGRYPKTQKTATSRQPAPVDYPRISIGDVGFIRGGQFHLLFSAGSPLGERVLGEDVPTTFEQLTVGEPVRGKPRPAGCLCTATVREIGERLGATLPTALYVLLLELPFVCSKMSRLGPWNLVATFHSSSPGTTVRHS